MRNIYIIGGSNSLMSNGWAYHLAEMMPKSVTNVSIGAATSLMGIFRLLRNDVPDGATVVWEYALNESNHFKSGQSLESLLYHLDWFMEIARRKSIRVLPLVLWTRGEQISGQRNRYRELLRQRFENDGLPVIDAFVPLQNVATEQGANVASYFDGNMHYSAETPFLERLAGIVRNNLEEATLPQAVNQLQGLQLTLCRPEGDGRDFSNSIFQAEVFTPSDELVLRANGKLLASYVIAAQNAGAIDVHADGSPVGAYSLQRPSGGNPRMLLLKHLVHWQKFSDIAEVKSRVTISDCAPENAPIVQNTFDWRGVSREMVRADAYICALLEHAS